jgi:hypothetical protein
LENKDKFSCSDDDSPVDDGSDGAANDGAANDGAVNDGAVNDGAANDAADDADILSNDSYNTEEEGRFVNSLVENYELRKK